MEANRAVGSVSLDPEHLLYTDLDGRRLSLQDVIYDGLDRDYSARHPALSRLLREGQPRHRLHACLMLASWGVEEGLRTLIQWARLPGSTPWADSPVTFDRFFGVDAAFEMMVEAVHVAGDVERGGDIELLRVEATRALLGIHHHVYVARSMMLLLGSDQALAASVRSEIAAVDRAIEEARARAAPFDLATQAAFLLGLLAELDDAHAARVATTLLADHGDRLRTAREVAHALGWGTGPATRAVLDRLAEAPAASVREDARASLRRRGIKPYPWLYAVNDRPVMIVRLPDGGADALVFDFKTGAFVPDRRYFARVADTGIGKDVDQLDEAAFARLVANLRRGIWDRHRASRIEWENAETDALLYRAKVEDTTITIRMNDFPAEPLYSVLVDGQEVEHLDDWPAAWVRPGAPRR